MRLSRPTRTAGREHPCDLSRANTRTLAAAPIRSCSRWGLPCRPCCQRRGALLPHRFALARGTGPLARTDLAQAVCFLWHCPWGRPRRRLAGTVFPWSPDFPLPADRSAGSGRPAVWRAQMCPRAASQVKECACGPEPFARNGSYGGQFQGRRMMPPPRTRSPS